MDSGSASWAEYFSVPGAAAASLQRLPRKRPGRRAKELSTRRGEQNRAGSSCYHGMRCYFTFQDSTPADQLVWNVTASRKPTVVTGLKAITSYLLLETE